MFLTKRSSVEAIVFERRAVTLAFALLATLMLAACGGNSGQQNQAPMLRAGSPEFEELSKKITITDKDALESPRPIGDIIMTLQGTVRNFTGRTLTGLEIRGVVVDITGKPIKERTITVLPKDTRQELENNQTMPVSFNIEGFSKNDPRANFDLQVTGLRVK